MNVWKKSLIGVGVVLIAVILLKDILIGVMISSVGSRILGAPVKLGAFHWNVFSQKIRLNDLRVEQPAGFSKGNLIDVREIGVDYNLGQLLKGKFYFPYVVVDVKEMQIIRNKQGKLNVDALNMTKNKESTSEQSRKSSSTKKNDIDLSIDVLKINIGSTIYTDYTNGSDQGQVHVFNTGLKDKTFKNIKSVNQLTTLILIQGMGIAAIKDTALYAASTIIDTAWSAPSKVGNVLYRIEGKLVGRE